MSAQGNRLCSSSTAEAMWPCFPLCDPSPRYVQLPSSPRTGIFLLWLLVCVWGGLKDVYAGRAPVMDACTWSCTHNKRTHQPTHIHTKHTNIRTNYPAPTCMASSYPYIHTPTHPNPTPHIHTHIPHTNTRTHLHGQLVAEALPQHLADHVRLRGECHDGHVDPCGGRGGRGVGGGWLVGLEGRFRMAMWIPVGVECVCV